MLSHAGTASQFRVTVWRKAQERLFFCFPRDHAGRGACSPRSERLCLYKEKAPTGPWDYIVCQTFLHSDWIQNFRVSIYLCLKISPAIKKKGHANAQGYWCKAEDGDYSMVYLASNSDFRTIAHI